MFKGQRQYLQRLGGFTQLFDDSRQRFRIDALLTQSHAYRQRLHVQTSVQQPRDLQEDLGRKTSQANDLLSTDSKTQPLSILCMQ